MTDSGTSLSATLWTGRRKRMTDWTVILTRSFRFSSCGELWGAPSLSFTFVASRGTLALNYATDRE